jgi:hypothetical protein
MINDVQEEITSHKDETSSERQDVSMVQESEAATWKKSR